MAMFRGLTAVEESVSGVFHALKYRGYRNAEFLKPRDHRHKNAAIPFLQVLGFFFEEFSETEHLQPKFHVKEEGGTTRLRIALSVKVGGKEFLAYPEPPLGLIVTSQHGRTPSFMPQIERFITEQNSSSMINYVKEQANLRNKLLYASAEGIPTVSVLKDEFFLLRKTQVTAMLMTYLLIEPYAERQQFAQHALDAFVAMLNGATDEFLQIEA